MRDDVATQAVGIAVYEARPRIVMCGHPHIEKPYTIYRYEYGALYVRVDSSRRHRAYLILTSNGRLEIQRDQVILGEQGL